MFAKKAVRVPASPKRSARRRGAHERVTSKKLAVSFEGGLADRVQRAAAEQTAGNVSAWLAEAAREHLRLQAARRFLDEYETASGVISREEIAEVEAQMASGLTLDSGALIAAEKRVRRFLAIWAAALERGARVTVPAVVLAQVWRGNSPAIARLLPACSIEDMDEPPPPPPLPPPTPPTSGRRKNRTFNKRIKSPLLYQLSYAPDI